MEQLSSTGPRTRGTSARVLDWLARTDQDLPDETRLAVTHNLYGKLPMFVGGMVNAVAVSTIIAFRIPQVAFLIWAAGTIAIAVARIPVLRAGRRAIADGTPGPVRLHIALALAWAAVVGYGTSISILSGDWVVATLACLSSAAMVGGICFRNYAAPRLVAAMIILSLGPCALAALMAGEAILLLVAFQIPVYLFAMTRVVFHFNHMLVATMLAERENDHRASHDMLTGLLNRAGLAREVAVRTAAGTRFELFYLDLDGFKTVNDTCGHQVGDELLKAVAERLRLVARPDDAIARIGGDEFVILSRCDDGDVLGFGQLLTGAIAQGSYRIGSECAEVGASIGVALYPQHGEDLGALLGEADTALYQAKFWGRSRCVIARSGGAVSNFPPTPARELELERNAA